MSLETGDKLFKFYSNNEFLNTYEIKFSYFGNSLISDTINCFKTYIDGYKEATNIVFDKYNSSDNDDYNILDTVVFPLCFMYRHVVELYIKYLYFKYSDKNDDERTAFLNRVNHKLKQAWEELKNEIDVLLKKMNCTVNISLIDNCINEIDEFDFTSFRMRYPINKDLSSTNDKVYKLDVIHLHDHMFELFGYFDSIDNELRGVIIDNYTEDNFKFEIIERYKNSRDNIVKIVNELKVFSENESKECIDINEIQLSDLSAKGNSLSIIDSFTFEDCAMIALMLYAGKEMEVNYSISQEQPDRNNDFYKVIEIIMKDYSAYIDFDGNITKNKMCEDLFVKGYQVTYRWIDRSYQVFEEAYESN